MLFPMTACYAAAVWALYAVMLNEIPWMQFSCFVVTTYLLVELNNSNALIRIFSRMVSCSYIVMACMPCFLFSSVATGIEGVCIVAAYATMFNSYQERRSMGWIFYTFLLLGIASLINIHILYYVPLFWFIILVFMMSLSFRTFIASLLGIITPYWFAMVYFIYTQDIDTPIRHFTDIAVFGPIADFSILNYNQLFTLSFVALLAVVGTVHFAHNNTGDKIRTRMLYYSFITIDIVTIVFVILQPQHYDLLLTMMIISTSPLIGHFIALTHTKLTNISFIIIAVAAFALTAYNMFGIIMQ